MTGGSDTVLHRTMMRAETDERQSHVALNEVYIGQPTHQSARYPLEVGGPVERQSSWGLIVGTGTGATGWCLSLQRVQAPDLALPSPGERALAWFVREPWPPPSTGASLRSGTVSTTRSACGSSRTRSWSRSERSRRWCEWCSVMRLVAACTDFFVVAGGYERPASRARNSSWPVVFIATSC